MRGVFLDLDSINPRDLDLGPLKNVLAEWDLYPQSSADTVAGRIRQAEVVVTNKVVLDRAALQQAEKLQLVCVAATGTNNVDIDTAMQLGIVVSNARNYATASVAEHVFSLLLRLIRQLESYHARVRQGHWSTSEHFCLFDRTIDELAGKSMGIIGYGVLGQRVARLAEAFSMDVLIAQRQAGPPVNGRLPLDELFRLSDVVSLHCPLTKENYHLVDRRALQLMKRSALLVNTARGGLVDDQALIEALQNEQIAGAAIDVLKHEPPPADAPLLQCKLPTLIVTPHVAWASRPARQRLLGEIIDNIEAYKRGSVRNQVLP